VIGDKLQNGNYKKESVLTFVYIHSKILRMLIEHSLDSKLFDEDD